MSLSIVVCIKPVPASDKATIDPVTKTVRRDSGDSVISSLDRHALEAAIRLKEQTGCEVTVLSMAPPSAQINLREALAQGADRALLISDRVFAGGDTLATSYVLASALKKLGGWNLILTGAHSDDGGTCQVPAQLAEWLGIPHLHNVFGLSVEDAGLSVKAAADQGHCLWHADLPVLLSVERRLNKTRLTTFKGIRAAKNKEIVIWSSSDLPDCDLRYVGLKGSPTQFGEMHQLDEGRACKMFRGDAKTIVRSILDKLVETGVQL